MIVRVKGLCVAAGRIEQLMLYAGDLELLLLHVLFYPLASARGEHGLRLMVPHEATVSCVYRIC
jgi:hypothetical protein